MHDYKQLINAQKELIKTLEQQQGDNRSKFNEAVAIIGKCNFGENEKYQSALKERDFYTSKIQETASTMTEAKNQLESYEKLLYASTTPDYSIISGMGEGNVTNESDEDSFVKSVYFARYAQENPKGFGFDHKIAREIYGQDYRQANLDQEMAFARFLNTDTPSQDVYQALKSNLLPFDKMVQFVRDGISVKTIKSIQVESIDVLGGYAVPPEREAEILRKMAGLTAVRIAGATVIQTNQPMVEWVKIESSGNIFSSGIREGNWVPETGAGGDKNLTFGKTVIQLHNYNYRVRVSQNALTSVQNMASIINEEIASAMAMDEDRTFLVGLGINEASGILPGGVNANGLTEIISGNANNITEKGVRSLKRGIASQYRMGMKASLIGNSNTALDIELFTDGNGQYFFRDGLDANQTRLYAAMWRESEFLQDVAANSYPLIYGNMRGYAIAERGGLRIARHQDSYTTLNQVWFEVRRSIGGGIIYPWMFAVQKVTDTP